MKENLGKPLVDLSYGCSKSRIKVKVVTTIPT